LTTQLLEKTFLTSKKWVKNIQTAGYNGEHTVYFLTKNILGWPKIA
jgi:hypothetical protein